jgi:small redox-active disulfide protein 2
MKIEVLGPGCPKCHDTFERIRHLLEELKLEAELVKITDVFEIIDKGISVTPALIVDGEVKFQGRVPSLKQTRNLLLEAKG